MLINTGRGGLIDTNALIESLKSGTGSYAGLDVSEREKKIFFSDRSDAVLQDDVFARLLGFQNVLITPHQACFTREALHEIAQTTLKVLTTAKPSQGGESCCTRELSNEKAEFN